LRKVYQRNIKELLRYQEIKKMVVKGVGYYDVKRDWYVELDEA
jgi:hypothetical protein